MSIFFLLMLPVYAFAGFGGMILKGNISPIGQAFLSLQYYATPFQNGVSQMDVSVDEKGNFRLEVPMLSHQRMNLLTGTDILFLHGKPGDSIYMEIRKTDNKWTAKYFGKGAKEAAWPQKQRDYFITTQESPGFSQVLLEQMGTRTPEGFKQYADSLTQVKINYLNKWSAGLDPEFVTWQTAEIRYEWETFKLNYPVWFYGMRGIENRELPVDSNYYDFLKKINLNEEAYLESGQYLNFLKYYFMREIRKTGMQMSANDLYGFAATMFKGKTLLVFRLHLWGDLMQYGNITDAQALYPSVKKELSQLKGYKELEFIFQEKIPYSIGSDAIPFTLKTIDGKTVSLSDFKGKVVYLDFWASWCGPCKREIPPGEELKKYFAGKDVVFLNISIDEDEMKWRNAVANLTFSGTHLLCNSQNNPKVLEQYRITTIPAYFLIGKDGKFAGAPAPRPSSSEIYGLIENALKK